MGAVLSPSRGSGPSLIGRVAWLMALLLDDSLQGCEGRSAEQPLRGPAAGGAAAGTAGAAAGRGPECPARSAGPARCSLGRLPTGAPEDPCKGALSRMCCPHSVVSEGAQTRAWSSCGPEGGATVICEGWALPGLLPALAQVASFQGHHSGGNWQGPRGMPWQGSPVARP